MDHAQTSQRGDAWVGAIAEQRFDRLALFCQPDVRSRIMTPSRFDTLETALDLAARFEQWFGESQVIRMEQAWTRPVGDRLAISYRLSLQEQGTWFEVEQYLVMALRAGLADHLDLMCSGFRPASVSPGPGADNAAVLRMEVGPEAGESTCALLTPALKARLRQLASGQVLQVRVGDTSVREDIEAWCRLSGNELLAVTADEGRPGLQFLIKKK